ncbi:hypothetical protein FGO68_gene12664 [Halteria grandinella]|uniref:Uncharacterized protein n=1 Tax=Halteria grandinella TaxID=5974 RepID=A0A8J8NSM3_HALGN|nr:hypothetical protein FGO68_gene12664 [Halteria grandinella]
MMEHQIIILSIKYYVQTQLIIAQTCNHLRQIGHRGNLINNQVDDQSFSPQLARITPMPTRQRFKNLIIFKSTHTRLMIVNAPSKIPADIKCSRIRKNKVVYLSNDIWLVNSIGIHQTISKIIFRHLFSLAIQENRLRTIGLSNLALPKGDYLRILMLKIARLKCCKMQTPPHQIQTANTKVWTQICHNMHLMSRHQDKLLFRNSHTQNNRRSLNRGILLLLSSFKALTMGQNLLISNKLCC